MFPMNLLCRPSRLPKLKRGKTSLSRPGIWFEFVSNAMGKESLKDSPIIPLEPDGNPITKRFGLPLVANYPPLRHVRLAARIPLT